RREGVQGLLARGVRLLLVPGFDLLAEPRRSQREQRLIGQLLPAKPVPLVLAIRGCTQVPDGRRRAEQRAVGGGNAADDRGHGFRLRAGSETENALGVAAEDVLLLLPGE